MSDTDSKVKGVLIDEPGTLFYWPLAKLFGFVGALIIQQIHYTTVNSSNIRDGHAWYFHPTSEWLKEFHGTVSKNTVERTIARLKESGILIVDNFNSVGFDRTRWFRLDRVKLAEALNAVGEEQWQVKGKQVAKAVVPQREHPVPTGGTPIHNSKKTIVKKLLSPVFDTAMVAGGSSPTSSTQVAGDDNVKALAIPKKRRVVPSRVESITEVVQATKKTRTEIVATRLVSVPSGLTVKNLQTLLDKAMGHYRPTLPRVIVTKTHFGLFRKRADEAKIDVNQFIDFVIRDWSTISSQNAASFRKYPERHKGTPLPAAPSFSDLAIRLPYFIKIFASNLTRGGEAGKTENPQETEIARLKAALATARQETVEARDLLRSERTRTRMRPSPSSSSLGIPGATLRTTSVRKYTEEEIEAALADDWVPPEWGDGPDDRTSTRM